MEWQPEDRDAWVIDAEKWISQIKGVLQCKIDIAPDGEISGVHVVARQDREPRHIVRDVEGLLKARLGISVFYKKIGVVQVVEADDPPDREATTPSASAAQQTLAGPAGPRRPASAFRDRRPGPGHATRSCWPRNWRRGCSATAWA